MDSRRVLMSQAVPGQFDDADSSDRCSRPPVHPDPGAPRRLPGSAVGPRARSWDEPRAPLARSAWPRVIGATGGNPGILQRKWDPELEEGGRKGLGEATWSPRGRKWTSQLSWTVGIPPGQVPDFLSSFSAALCWFIPGVLYRTRVATRVGKLPLALPLLIFLLGPHLLCSE